jgi:hypothetical protein
LFHGLRGEYDRRVFYLLPVTCAPKGVVKHAGRDKDSITFFKPEMIGFHIKIQFSFFHNEEFSLGMTMEVQGIIKIGLYYRMMQRERAGTCFVYDIFCI